MKPSSVNSMDVTKLLLCNVCYTWHCQRQVMISYMITRCLGNLLFSEHLICPVFNLYTFKTSTQFIYIMYVSKLISVEFVFKYKNTKKKSKF